MIARQIVTDDAVGVEIRRLARKYRIRRDGFGSDLLVRLDNRMLAMRYFSKRGISLVDYAEFLRDNVVDREPCGDDIVELFAHFLPGRRRTSVELRSDALNRLETAGVAAELVAAQERTVVEWRDRIRRGSKLVSWTCDCEKKLTVWTSYLAQLNATCNACGAVWRRKTENPSLDMGAIAAAQGEASNDENAPF